MLGEPSDICTDCGASPQDVRHLFACTTHPTDLSPEDLWRNPAGSIRAFSYLDNETLTDLKTDLVVANNNNNTLQQNRWTFINYKKADWTQFTEDTESAFVQTTIPTTINTANIIFTNIILMSDKHNIPKGKMHSNCRLLPDHLLCKITQRNNIRRSKTCDPALKLLNEEITSDIQKHKHIFFF